ncbi:hypothetical protein F4782DRAFT_531019 [Xylaria castorea]|nr:hypothetical protein F4782DRAFT_531019 [Xylaria castorea]
MRRIKCDGKVKPFLPREQSFAFSTLPRSREAGADSKIVELPSPPGQTHDRKLENALQHKVSEEWLSLFPETATSALVQDDGFESVQDEHQGSSLDSAFVKPPLPTSTHQNSSAVMKRTRLRIIPDSFTPYSSRKPVLEPLLFTLPRQSSATVNDTTRTQRQPRDATQIVSPTHSVLPQRRQKSLLPFILDDPFGISIKRARNTLAARKSRERKAQRLEELEEKIAKLEQERDNWKNVAMKQGAKRSG